MKQTFRNRIAPGTLLAALLILTPLARAADPWVTVDARQGSFSLASDGRAATLVVSPADFKVVDIASNDLATDIERVTGLRPEVTTTMPAGGGSIVLIGTIGQNPLIDRLAAEGQPDIARLSGAWESFVISTVTDPFPGVPQALVIAGSDRRGTAYGVYELSQAIGVSPWHWWADSKPQHRDALFVAAGTRRFGPPSVKYRGIFINDEDWGLHPWAAKTFEPEYGDIGPKTYGKVFELLLRLRANTLWPAMHECIKPFNADPRNAALADDYAIVMGSSHAEPMLRNNVGEWTAPKEDYNYIANRDGVLDYWEERLRTNGRYENLYTLGMRGIHDSHMIGPKTDAGRIASLERIFSDQRSLLGKHVDPDDTRVPQIFCAYKEVLDLYRQGLRVPDDVTIVWPDDNFGYIRNFASEEEQKRSGGFGIYYHISYLGTPLSYIWLDSTPPALIWEEMTKAYHHGADRVWIVNVGDIKPMSIGMEFFLRLGWDVNQWGPDAQPAYLRDFAAREFGAEHAGEIAAILGECYRRNFRRRPEHLQWWLRKEPPHASPLGDAEIRERLAAFDDLSSRTDRVAAALPVEKQDAFEELVGYTVHASALANTRYFEGELGNIEAAKAADRAIAERTRRYNEDLAGGKWRGILAAEPADEKWAGRFRIDPWEPPVFKKPGAPPAPAMTEPGKFAPQTRDVHVVKDLGRSGNAVVLTSGSQVECEAMVPAGEFAIRVHVLPTHPVSGAEVRLGIAIDGGPVQEVLLPLHDGGPAWEQGVLDNEVIATIDASFPRPGTHTIHFHGIDDGIVLDRITILPR